MSSQPTPPSAPNAGHKPSGRFMPILLGIAFIAAITAAALVGSWSAGNLLKKAAAPLPPAPSTVSTPTPEPAPAAPTPATADDLKALRGEVEGLAKQLAALATKVDGLPKAEPAPDLKPIQAKLDDLGGLAEKFGELSKKVDAADEQARAASKAADSSKEEIAALTAKIDKPVEAVAPKPTAEPKLADIGPAAELFRANKFADARAALAKLRQSNPEDARVWYYSALANGFATGKWDGETEQLVLKGVERERIGTPDAAQIDAAFSGLAGTAGKSWLAAYRRRARR
jgi:hypothetical protein